jgi:hypothetical protein
MKKFANSELILHKSVKRGDKKSLLMLFSAPERYKPIEVLTNAEEDAIVKVILEGLGEIDLKLGDDMVKGQKKTIMTLFWFFEREKSFEMKRDAEAGERIPVKMLLVS